MPTEREARMSMVLIESRPTPINVSLHGMRHTDACHRNTAPQKQPYAYQYAASHKHVFRRDLYKCLVFQAIDLPYIDLHDIVFRYIKKKPHPSMSRCMGHAYTSHYKPTSRQQPYDERCAAPHWHVAVVSPHGGDGIHCSHHQSVSSPRCSATCATSWGG
jgi:hypothetical protein